MQTTERQLEVLLNERNKIHAEVLSHKATQQAVLNLMIVLIAAELAAFSQVSATFAHIQLILLLVPIPFALLATYHSGYTARIHHIAAYLDGELRQKIELRTSDGLLCGQSYQPIRNPVEFKRARPEGRMICIALLGLKSFPQIVPLAIWLGSNQGAGPWLWVLFIADCCVLALTITWQQD